MSEKGQKHLESCGGRAEPSRGKGGGGRGGVELQSSFSEGRRGRGKGEDLKVNCGLGPDSWEGWQGWQMGESKPASSHRSVRGACLGSRKRILTSMLVQKEPVMSDVFYEHRVDGGGAQTRLLELVCWATGGFTHGKGLAQGPPNSELESRVSLASLEKLCTLRKMWLRMSKLLSSVLRTSSRIRREGSLGGSVV